MNSKINALKKLATVEVRSHGAFGESERYEQVDLDKFAELIIRECASICEVNGESYMYSFTPAKARLAESTSRFRRELIKKHFGVEK